MSEIDELRTIIHDRRWTETLWCWSTSRRRVFSLSGYFAGIRPASMCPGGCLKSTNFRTCTRSGGGRPRLMNRLLSSGRHGRLELGDRPPSSSGEPRATVPVPGRAMESDDRQSCATQLTSRSEVAKGRRKRLPPGSTLARLGVGDAVRGFFGGSGQRSHAELPRPPAARRAAWFIGLGSATR